MKIDRRKFYRKEIFETFKSVESAREIYLMLKSKYMNLTQEEIDNFLKDFTKDTNDDNLQNIKTSGTNVRNEISGTNERNETLGTNETLGKNVRNEILDTNETSGTNVRNETSGTNERNETTGTNVINETSGTNEMKKILKMHKPPSLRTIYRWINKFEKGKNDFDDLPRSGHPITKKTLENVNKIEQVLNNNPNLRLIDLQQFLLTSDLQKLKRETNDRNDRNDRNDITDIIDITDSTDITDIKVIKDTKDIKDIKDIKDKRDNVKKNFIFGIDSNTESNIDSNTESNIERNLEPNIESNIEPNINSDIEPNNNSDIKSITKSNIKSKIDSKESKKKKHLNKNYISIGCLHEIIHKCLEKKKMNKKWL